MTAILVVQGLESFGPTFSFEALSYTIRLTGRLVVTSGGHVRSKGHVWISLAIGGDV